MIRPTTHQKKLLLAVKNGALHRLSVGRAGRPTSYIYGVTGGINPRPPTVAVLEENGWIDWTHSNTAVLTNDGRAVL